MEAYYDPRKGLGSAYKFYKSQKKYTYEQVKAMLEKQEAYQLNKQGTKTAYFPIVGVTSGSYQADLMFPNEYKGYTCILCIINVITRVAYCYAQKSKSETYNNMAKFLEDVEGVNFIQTDSGSEFVNRKVSQLFEDKGIEFHAVDPGDHTGQGKIERFNQTLRRLITIYQSAYKTLNWVKVLDDLVYNYNHRYHRSIGCAPIDADEATVFDQELGKYDLALKQFNKFAVGDKVRVLINKDIFDKGRKEWSPTVYRIDQIEGHRLHVPGIGWKKHYELQRIEGVHTKLLDDNTEIDRKAIKKEKKVKRDLRKEGVSSKDVIEYGKNLIGKRVKDGKDKGVIFKYDRIGDYKWWVRFDGNRDDEAMNLEEIKRMLDGIH